MRKVLLGTFALAALTVLALSGATDTPAEAARGGGKGGGKPSTSSATMSVSPNPAPVGITAVTVSGAGFKAGEGLLVGIPGVFPGYGITADSSGNFTFTYSKSGDAPFSAGTYPFEAWGWKGSSRILRASTALVVQ